MKPAIVQYQGRSCKKFTRNKQYEAYFLEYWEGIRNSLHVRGNDGQITDFNEFEKFTVLSDEDDLLNTYEAEVLCLTHRYDDPICGLTYGKTYKAIGRDRDGFYLVMDDSYCCYFYRPEWFRVLKDDHGILSRQSVYYNFHGGQNPRKE